MKIKKEQINPVGQTSKASWATYSEDFVPSPLVNRPEVNTKASDVQVGGAHYKNYKIQPAQFLQVNKIPYIESCIVKYALRHKDKNGIEDLKKIKHYVDLLIEWEYDNEKE